MRWLRGLRRGWADFKQTIMYSLLARQKTWVVWLFITASVWVITQIGMADTLQKLVDKGVVERSKPVGDYVDLLVFLAFVGLFSGIAFRQVIARLTYHLEFELRVWLYERLQSTEPERLDGLATGQMVTRAMTDLLLLQLVVLILPAIAIVGLSLLAVFVLMATIHLPLAIVAVTVIPANVVIVDAHPPAAVGDVLGHARPAGAGHDRHRRVRPRRPRGQGLRPGAARAGSPRRGGR